MKVGAAAAMTTSQHLLRHHQNRNPVGMIRICFDIAEPCRAKICHYVVSVYWMYDHLPALILLLAPKTGYHLRFPT